MSYQDIPCRRVADLVTESLEGALDLDQELAVEHHLAICPDCTELFHQIRLTVELAGALRPDDVPERVMDNLTRAFRQRHGAP